jgi:hypothetical protein
MNEANKRTKISIINYVAKIYFYIDISFFEIIMIFINFS